jgi:uncharacterized RDD family membrane protein YckC
MNLESTPSKKNNIPKTNEDFSMDDFDFKPLTSGLGFHHPKQAEPKAVSYSERSIPVSTPIIQSIPRKDSSNVYQNDLSLFYGQQSTIDHQTAKIEEKEEVVYRNASKAQRSFAYVLDLTMVLSVLGIVLTIMARTIEMDLLEVWSAYPNEITPLVVIMFCGFYMIYFSIFEKSGQSTLGKNLLNLRVVNSKNQIQEFHLLLLRSFITLTNFVSLGLFSYFDLQNKVTNSKVIRVD